MPREGRIIFVNAVYTSRGDGTYHVNKGMDERMTILLELCSNCAEGYVAKRSNDTRTWIQVTATE